MTNVTGCLLEKLSPCYIKKKKINNMTCYSLKANQQNSLRETIAHDLATLSPSPDTRMLSMPTKG